MELKGSMDKSVEEELLMTKYRLYMLLLHIVFKVMSNAKK